MCMGLEILGAVLSIAQAGIGYAAQAQQAKAQNAAAERNRLNAVAAGNDKYAAINNDTLLNKDAASAKLFDQKIEEMKAKATARVAAGENGVTGLSVAALLNDFGSQAFRRAQATQINYQMQAQHNADELISANHQVQSRINSVRYAADASPAAAIVQGLGGVVGAFSKAGNAGGGAVAYG